MGEAIALMNWVTAEEVALKNDSVAIEQTMKGLTMTAVPTVNQAIKPASIPQAQLQNTFKQQNGGKNHNPYKTNQNIRATNRNKKKKKPLKKKQKNKGNQKKKKKKKS